MLQQSRRTPKRAAVGARGRRNRRCDRASDRQFLAVVRVLPVPSHRKRAWLQGYRFAGDRVGIAESDSGSGCRPARNDDGVIASALVLEADEPVLTMVALPRPPCSPKLTRPLLLMTAVPAVLVPLKPMTPEVALLIVALPAELGPRKLREMRLLMVALPAFITMPAPLKTSVE